MKNNQPVGLDPQLLSAFWTLETGELTPVIQWDWVHGINSQMRQQTYVFVITSPSAQPTNGAIYTNNNHTYYCTWSATTTFVAEWDGLPLASWTLTKVSGTGDATLTFSSYTIQNGTINGTGATIDTDASRLRIQSGTLSTWYAYIESRKPIRYRAWQWTMIRFTPVFTAGVANNIQLRWVGAMSWVTPYDGYFFGYNWVSFWIVHYVRWTPAWTLQNAWTNLNNIDWALDWTKGSPVMIKYPYLGYGTIEFFVERPTGGFVLVHTINYPNTVATTQLSNPTMYFMWFTLNSWNTTNQIMYCGSIGAFISGARSFVGNPKWAMDSNKSGITTETNLLTLKNCVNYNGVVNRGTIRINAFSFGNGTTTNNTIATFRVKINATLWWTPSYTARNGTTTDGGNTITAWNSIISYDTAWTTVTWWEYIFNTSVWNWGNVIIDATPLNIYLAPWELMTISWFATNSATLAASVNRSEDI